MTVALFTRAWIEITQIGRPPIYLYVALFTRAWIEIYTPLKISLKTISRPLHEGVD